MTNLEVGKGYLKKDDLKGLEYIIETVQSVQFPRLTQEEFELREEFEYYRKRHGSYERYQTMFKLTISLKFRGGKTL